MLGELKLSGLGVAAFASRHEVDQQRIYYWLKRSTAAEPPATLVEVKMPSRSATAASRERIELELVSGHSSPCQKWEFRESRVHRRQSRQ